MSMYPQCKRVTIDRAVAGDSCSISIRHVKRKDANMITRRHLRRGMVLIDESAHPKAYWMFDADVCILHHPTTIRPCYQAVIHCGMVRQTAVIDGMNREYLRTEDKAKVRFRFLSRAEILHPGETFVFREGSTKGIGRVVSGVEGDVQEAIRRHDLLKKENAERLFREARAGAVASLNTGGASDDAFTKALEGEDEVKKDKDEGRGKEDKKDKKDKKEKKDKKDKKHKKDKKDKVKRVHEETEEDVKMGEELEALLGLGNGQASAMSTDTSTTTTPAPTSSTSISKPMNGMDVPSVGRKERTASGADSSNESGDEDDESILANAFATASAASSVKVNCTDSFNNFATQLSRVTAKVGDATTDTTDDEDNAEEEDEEGHGRTTTHAYAYHTAAKVHNAQKGTRQLSKQQRNKMRGDLAIAEAIENEVHVDEDDEDLPV